MKVRHVLAVTLTALFAMDAPAAPNVLLIYTDDHGWADLALQGADKDIRTPNLDQLARDGVRFTRGYVTAPQCVPSRAGVISGTHQNRFGVEDNQKGPLPLDVLTLPQRLKRAGYVTGMSGKWHLDHADKKSGPKKAGMQRDHLPHAHGFDEYWCGAMRQYDASHSLAGEAFADAPHTVADNRFRITVQTEAALGFLNRRKANPEVPWFLYLAWFAPHVPLESPEPWFSKTPAHLPKERRQALAMIAAMDDGIGLLREKLKEMGADKNTLIFFIGDNGAPVRPGAWNGSLNTPLIGEKGMLTDGGVRVPFVAAWPGTIPGGQSYDQPVVSLDVAATAVALAKLPHDDQLDGVNLMPWLLGEEEGAPHEALYWRWRSQAAVLEFPWKLIRLGEKEQFLFNVTRPEGEKHNLLAQHPEIAARLDVRLNAWSATLKLPGAAEPLNPQDAAFFSAHVEARPGVPPATADAKKRRSGKGPAATETEADDVQGWLCRSGRIQVQGGALVIIPPEGRGSRAQPFITRSGISVEGPVTATLRIKAQKGGSATFAWRTHDERDFMPANQTTFEWPAGSEWQEVRVLLPVTGRLIHVRIIPPAAAQGLEVRSVSLQGKDKASEAWQFGGPG